jgi:hypothetical protein
MTSADPTHCRWLPSLLLAAILVTGCPSTPDDPPPDHGTFTALTYNVHGLPPQITGDDTTARMEIIGPRLPGYWLVGLQEDFVDENHAILDASTDHPTKIRFGEPLEDRVYGSGLALFAELYEVEHQHTYFDACNGITDGASDCLASKGFQRVRLTLGGDAVLDVYNTHMEAGGGEEDDAARQVHVDQLVDAMTTDSADVAILFMGDTNLHGDDPDDLPLIEQLLGEPGLTEVCDAVDCPEPGRIDRIAIRDGGGVSLTAEGWAVEPGFFDDEGVPLSDHDPISAEIAWDAR